MHTQIKQQIIQACEANPSEEQCGFIVADINGPKLVQCRNTAPNPRETFLVDPLDYLKAKDQGNLLAAWHSHPVDAGFSNDDFHYAQGVALPHYLYSVPSKTWSEYIPPTYQPPFEGQPFVIGFHDCFATVRDYWRQKFGVYISDYDRDEAFLEAPTTNILDHYEKEGFCRAAGLATLRKHDVMIFTVTHAMPQHFGIFVGNSRILHHPLKGLSRTDLFSTNWQRRVKAILRHKSNPG